MTEILIESKDFEEGEPIKVIMGGMLYTGIVSETISGIIYTSTGFFNLNSPGVKAYRIKEVP